MGGGKSGGAQTAGLTQNLASQQGRASDQIFQLTQPTQQLGAGQITDILKTGGVGAQVPAIQAAVQGQQRATQQAQSQIGESLSRAGAGGAVSDRILQEIGQRGGSRGAALRSSLTAPVFQQALGSAFGAAPLAQAAAGGAAGTQVAGTRITPPNTVGSQRLGGALGQLANNPAFLQALSGLFGG